METRRKDDSEGCNKRKGKGKEEGGGAVEKESKMENALFSLSLVHMRAQSLSHFQICFVQWK